MTLKIQLSESKLCSAQLQRRQSDLKPLIHKHICPKPSGYKAASHHKLASLSQTKAVPLTGVCWSMKICISHLPVSYTPTVYVSTKDGMQISLTTQDTQVLFYNSLNLLHCNGATEVFHCHGESKKSSQTLGNCHSTWKLIKNTHPKVIIWVYTFSMHPLLMLFPIFSH